MPRRMTSRGRIGRSCRIRPELGLNERMHESEENEERLMIIDQHSKLALASSGENKRRLASRDVRDISVSELTLVVSTSLQSDSHAVVQFSSLRVCESLTSIKKLASCGY